MKGLRLVPVEPVKEMTAAAAHLDWYSREDVTWPQGYRSMIAAAPDQTAWAESIKLLIDSLLGDAAEVAAHLAMDKDVPEALRANFKATRSEILARIDAVAKCP